MKNSVLYLFLSVPSFLFAQELAAPAVSLHHISLPATECITEEQRFEIIQEIEHNKQLINKREPKAFQRGNTHPLFVLPLRPKAGFEDYGYYSLFNQVDHNLTPNGNLLDYNCGERSYDWATGNHQGTDYVVWPYPWKKMEEDVMEVIAAAPGIIVQKRDGFFDHNCSNNGNPNWNGIILEHDDGSQSWYWHFKNGSLTYKNVGDEVDAGEFLGRAGSSGSSDIPHLHFEVRDTGGQVIDPYAGPCNGFNADSWWADQPPYFVPEILTLSTHDEDSYDTECGIVENTYEELNFLPGETVYFRIFYRDLQTNARTHINVKRPDGTVLYDYDYDSPWENLSAAYLQWNFPTDNSYMDGIYTITVDFAGSTYHTIFGLNTDLGTENEDAPGFSFYPNPTSGLLYIEGSTQIENVVVHDLLGRKIMEVSPLAIKVPLDLNGLKTGVYLTLVTSEGRRTVRKIIKN